MPEEPHLTTPSPPGAVDSAEQGGPSQSGAFDGLALRSYQERKLLRQLERIAVTNGFYRAHWRGHAADPGKVRTVEDLRTLPFVTKQDLLADQTSSPPYGKRLGVPPSEVHEITLTSGTSGLEKEVHAHTLADARLRGQLTAVGWSWAGMSPNDIGVAHFAANNAASLGSVDRGIRSIGRMPYLVGHASFDERLQMMESYGVDVMFAMPSALTALAKRCSELGKDPKTAFPRLRAVICGGESWPVEWAQRMEEFWGIRIYEVYGSTQTNAAFGAASCEVGAVAGGARGRNHLFEWTTYYEVIHPVTTEPTPPGERGELVITHLDKEASPLVRFRTGDTVRWFPAGACPCGRWLRSVESGTVGRNDDMLKIRGQNVWTSSVDSVVLAHPEVDEFQVMVDVDQRGRDTISMALALNRGYEGRAAELVSLLMAELKATTNLRFDIRVVPGEDVLHFDSPDRKARRWTDNRATGLSLAAQSLR